MASISGVGAKAGGGGAGVGFAAADAAGDGACDRALIGAWHRRNAEDTIASEHRRVRRNPNIFHLIFNELGVWKLER
jgi:hypothetical protein